MHAPTRGKLASSVCECVEASPRPTRALSFLNRWRVIRLRPSRSQATPNPRPPRLTRPASPPPEAGERACWPSSPRSLPRHGRYVFIRMLRVHSYTCYVFICMLRVHSHSCCVLIRMPVLPLVAVAMGMHDTTLAERSLRCWPYLPVPDFTWAVTDAFVGCAGEAQ